MLITSSGLEETLHLAEQIGRKLKGGEIIELISDLGGGKTAFVRGLAAGMGSTDTVRSPSFTISNKYSADKLKLYHFDFYRLQEPGIMKDELAEILTDPNAVVALEWAGIIDDVLPTERLQITFKVTDENQRFISIKCPNTLDYLTLGISNT